MIQETDLIQTLVERSIEEQLRLELVQEGYLPNYLDYPTPVQWANKLSEIANDNGFAIELFGNSNSQAKGLKKVPRIVLVSGRMVPGDIGDLFEPKYEKQLNGSYVKLKVPYQLSNFQFEVHLVSNDTRQHRILHAIWNKRLGTRKYIPLYTDPTQLFFIENIGYYDNPDTSEGITENIFTHEVKDLFLYDGIKISDVAQILQINLAITAFGESQFPDEAANGEVTAIKVNPYMFINNFYLHSGAPTKIIPIPNITNAVFTDLTLGVTPIHQFKQEGNPPVGFYKINQDNTITLYREITDKEKLSYNIQL